jgi:hypothetical protein
VLQYKRAWQRLLLNSFKAGNQKNHRLQVPVSVTRLRLTPETGNG